MKNWTDSIEPESGIDRAYEIHIKKIQDIVDKTEGSVTA
jgi:hypothetical protein